MIMKRWCTPDPNGGPNGEASHVTVRTWYPNTSFHINIYPFYSLLVVFHQIPAVREIMGIKLHANELLNIVNRKNLQRLAELGGVEKLAATLDSHATKGISLTESELVARREFYGRHNIPQPPSKSFLQFVWKVMQEKILLALIIVALVELAIGIYKYQFNSKSAGEEATLVDGFAILLAGTFLFI